MELKKVVLKLCVHDDKYKKKAMEAVASLSGVESLAMDMKEKKLTVIGDVDAVAIVKKLRKLCRTNVLTVGPAKEPEKKKEDPKKAEKQIEEHVRAHNAYNPYVRPCHYVQSAEENPNCCVIC